MHVYNKERSNHAKLYKSFLKMKDLGIGVFDSGIGGLTAVKAISEFMPGENIIYFGDTLRMPYGNKNTEDILCFADQNIRFLESMGVKVIVAACGTVSSYIERLNSNVPIFEVITPACKAAVKVTKNSKIGVIGTTAAIKSNSYLNCISEIQRNVKCWQRDCPLLASLIEDGNIEYTNEDLKKNLDSYISPLIKKGIDTLVLGCTHYPVVQPVIKKMFGDKLNLIDPSRELAIALKKFFIDNHLNKAEEKMGNHNFYVSGDPEKFSLNAEQFLNREITVKNINIEAY